MNRHRARFHSVPGLAPLILAPMLLFFAPLGCSSDDSAGTQRCEGGERWNELRGRCEQRPVSDFDAAGPGKDSSSNPGGPDWVIGERDTGSDADADTDADEGSDTTTPGGQDAQEPGGEVNCMDPTYADDPACQFQTCLDLLPGEAPDDSLGCVETDINCVDGKLDCSFYAHSPTQLYRVDPYRKTLVELGQVPDLTDIDTHPDGTLYGISFQELFKYDPQAGTWRPVGPLGVSGSPNGLAINNQGMAFMTAGDTVYSLDLEIGHAAPMTTLGSGFRSSGDCVVNKGNSLFMSSKATGLRTSDILVYIDNGGTASAVGTEIGFDQVYGLTAAWNRMFGLTGRGELIEIDQTHGNGTLIHRFDGIVWNGAASTPSR